MSLRPIDFAVLGMLRFRPMTGYEIKNAYQRGPANFMPISYGQIYPVLANLAKQKLIVAESRRGARGSVRYSLCSSGQEAVHEWVAAPDPSGHYRELLLRLFFASRNELPSLQAALRRFIEQERAELTHFEQIGKWLDEVHGKNPRLPIWKMVMQYGVLQSKAHLRWAELAIDFTESFKKKEQP